MLMGLVDQAARDTGASMGGTRIETSDLDRAGRRVGRGQILTLHPEYRRQPVDAGRNRPTRLGQRGDHVLEEQGHSMALVACRAHLDGPRGAHRRVRTPVSFVVM